MMFGGNFMGTHNFTKPTQTWKEGERVFKQIEIIVPKGAAALKLWGKHKGHREPFSNPVDDALAVRWADMYCYLDGVLLDSWKQEHVTNYEHIFVNSRASPPMGTTVTWRISTENYGAATDEFGIILEVTGPGVEDADN